MKRETQIILASIIIIILVFFVCRPGENDDEQIKVQPGQSDIDDIIAEAESAIKEAPVKQKPEEDRPENPYQKRDTRDERDEHSFEYEENPYMDTTQSKIKLQDTSETTTEEENQKSLEAESGTQQTDSLKKQEEIEAEREKIDSFLRGLLNWTHLGRTATQSRSKAYEIRQEAKSIRREASLAEPHIKPIMIERADLMEKYSNRLSATRGNDRKIRILMADLEDELAKGD